MTKLEGASHLPHVWIIHAMFCLLTVRTASATAASDFTGGLDPSITKVESGGPDATKICVGKGKSRLEATLQELLPSSFGPDTLE